MLTLGDPLSGMVIAYWPQMDGWNPGYDLLCTLRLFATRTCWPDGQMNMHDIEIRIVPQPQPGLIQGSCWPENSLSRFAGLVSMICPVWIQTQSSSWGAIKGLF